MLIAPFVGLADRTRVKRAAQAAVGIVVAGLLVLVTWLWVDRQLSQRALARHMERGKAYAARMLEEVGVVPDALRESSGLAVSRTQPGVFWSHNDSGDRPNLYAIDQSGRLLATIRIMGAVNRDWEDMALGPCPANVAAPMTPCLYLADTGDNNRAREDVTVFVLVEPVLATGAPPLTAASQSFRYRYPREPEDSEAFAVLPNGDVTVVTKGLTGTIDFFGFSAVEVARALTSREVLTARYQGNSGIEPDQRIGRYVTGAAVSPDGMTLAVRTYNEVFFFGATEVGPGRRGWRDLRRPCFLDDAEPQGEAIDYLDAETLLLTSERARGRPGTIHRLRCG